MYVESLVYIFIMVNWILKYCIDTRQIINYLVKS